MNERFKYALNGVYRCENFAQQLANDDFTSERIRSAAGGFRDWHIKLKINSPTANSVYPILFSGFNQQLSVHYYFNFVKKDGSSSFRRAAKVYLKPNQGPRGFEMNILELLNMKNGYLDNGALMIEYGVQVESVLGEDKIWRFNTEDPLFDCQEKKNMIKTHCRYYSNFYVHKQLFTFHSSYFRINCKESKVILKESTTDNGRYQELENFLQICQGVHVKLEKLRWARIINIASKHSFPNVIRYCERELIENDLKLKYLKSWVIHWDGLRHYLVHLLKNMKSPRELIKKKKYIRKMSGETMKIFVAKFVYNKF